jgi:HK97 gp10 family phage protein
MKASIEVEGIEDAMSAFRKLGKEGRQEAQTAIEESLQSVRTTAVNSIQRGTKSGRTYTNTFARINGQLIITGERVDAPNLSASHTASAPGEAPATDTGTLVSSIKVSTGRMSGEVGSKLPYAFFLEYGTLYMDARPFLRPALEANQQYIIDALTRGLQRAIARFNAR